MSNKNVGLCLVLFAFLFLNGCATLVNGTHQIVPVSSSPLGAHVMVDGNLLFETPCQIRLRRNETHILRFSMAGYNPTEFHLTRASSSAGYGNIAFGGLIGAGIDLASGANYKLVPASVHVTLSPIR